MPRFVFMLCFYALVLCFLAGQDAMAYEVTADDVVAAATQKVIVKSPPNPELVGFFKSSQCEIFSYALLEREGRYEMFVKIKGKYEGWATATIDGDEIVFGKQGKARISLEQDGSIYRIFNGKKTPLVKIQ